MMVSEQIISKFKSVSKSASDNCQMVADLIRSETGLEQSEYGLQ
jgi:hypothetical protein